MPRDRTYAVMTVVCAAMITAAPAQAGLQDGGTAGEKTVASAPQGSEALRYAAARIGYRFLTPGGTAAAASPYTLLSPGVMGGIAAGNLEGDLKISTAATVLNQDDYHAELLTDYQGRYRLHLESEALRHNLPAELLPPGEAGSYLSKDHGPGASYGIRSTTSQANGRIRLGNLPFHLELGYWQMDREGQEQLRFSDYYFGAPNSIIQSDLRRIDSTTREGLAGFDAMLGPLGIAYEFRVRDFSSNAPLPRHPFAVTAGGALIPGSQTHDTTPGSRVMSHTFKAYSDMSGGLSGSASYNLTERDNRGDGGDARPSSAPSTAVHSAAGDLSYTPLRELTLALKYRHQEIDRQSPATVIYPFIQTPAAGPVPGVFTPVTGQLLVRPSSSSVRDSIAASAIYRPDSRASLRLEYRAELESRDRLPDPQSPGSPVTAGGDSRQTHTGKAEFSWRPRSGVRLNGSYAYSMCDNPATVAAFTEQHDGRISLSYTARGAWGATAFYRVRQESADSTVTTSSTLTSYRLPRESRSSSSSASVWLSPLPRLTLTTSYAYQETSTEQTFLFSASPAPGNGSPNVATDYAVSAHIYGIDAVYALSETFDVALAFQQILSRSRFFVPERPYPLSTAGTSNTSGITALTSSEATETGVTTRFDWHISRSADLTVDYSYRQISSEGPLPDGTLHATMLSLLVRW